MVAVVDLDLHPVDQLHALFGRLNLLRRELRFRVDEGHHAVIDLALGRVRVTFTLDPSFTRERSVSLIYARSQG